MKKTILALFLLVILLLGGCSLSASEAANTRNTEAVILGEKGQKLADGIWAARSLWSGCSELAIYQHNGTYYLAANFLVRSSTTNDMFGKTSTVGTYKRYAYRIEDGKIIDDLTLADAGVTSVGRRIGAVNMDPDDSSEVQKALISQLVSKMYGHN